MNEILMKSILAMDAYNHGIAASVLVDQVDIGNATIYRDSEDIVDIASDAVYANFYAISYDYNNQKVISYRGTDDPLGGYILDGDVWNGWFGGAGSVQSKQAELAFKFYQNIVDGVENAFSENVFLTGHSLGGGLAGLVGGVYQQEGVLFDNMPFEAAVQNTIYATADMTPPEDFNCPL